MKNPGPTLTTVVKGGFRNIPPELLAKIGIQTVVTEVDPAVSEDTIGATVGTIGSIIEAKVEQERTDERKRTTTILKDYGVTQGGGQLVSAELTPFGQNATKVTKLVDENSLLPSGNALTESAVQQNTGLGKSVNETTTVLAIPQEVELATEGGDPVPDKFKQLAPDVTQSQVVVSGTVAQPTLTSNQLRVSEKQIKLYRKLVTQWQRAGTLISMLPLTLVGYRINDVGQLVIVTEVLRVSAANPTPSARVTFVVQDLGNGTQVITTETIANTLPRTVYEVTKPDVTPEDFKALLPLTETENVVEATSVSPPALGTNDLRASEQQLTAFTKLSKLLQRQGVSLPVSLVGRDTNDKKQDVTVTRTLQSSLTASPNPSELRDVVVQQLGDGNVVVTTRVIASVFANQTYEVSRPDSLPEDFKVALPSTESEAISAGTVGLPVLGTNDLRASQEQLTAFTKMVKTLTRAGISLPVSLVGHDTNDKKQDVIVTRTIQTWITTIPVPTEVREVVSQSLGNGTPLSQSDNLVTTRVVAALFLQPRKTIHRNDAIPPEFMAFVTQTTSSTNVIGAMPDPTLASETVLEQTNEQVDATTYRTTTTSKNLVSSDANLDQNFEIVTEFGGGIAQRVKILSVSGLVVAPSKLVLMDKVTDVGYNGWQVREYLILIKDGAGNATSVWPILSGTEIDEAGELVTPFTQQVVDAGTVGSIFNGTITEVKPIDFLRSLKTVRVVPSTIDTVIQMFPGYSTIREIPPQLNSVTGLTNSISGANGSYNESTGTYAISAPGSASVALHGSCFASAGIIRDITYDVTIPRTVDVRVARFVFYVTYSTDLNAQLTAIIARLVSAGVTGVNVMPRFFPKVETFFCPGMRARGEVNANVTAVDHASVNYLGQVVGLGRVRTGGVGSAQDVEISIKVIRLPPTIHGAISVGSATVANAVSSTSGSLGIQDSSTQVLSSTVTVPGNGAMSITPVSLFATPETPTIPTGNFITALHTEPYKNARMKVYAEVCDFGAEVV